MPFDRCKPWLFSFPLFPFQFAQFALLTQVIKYCSCMYVKITNWKYIKVIIIIITVWDKSCHLFTQAYLCSTVVLTWSEEVFWKKKGSQLSLVYFTWPHKEKNLIICFSFHYPLLVLLSKYAVNPLFFLPLNFLVIPY